MKSIIYTVSSGNELTRLERQPYDSEDLLQRLLADHPDVLGEAVGTKDGLLLIGREHGVPDTMDGSGRWSLDHLFVDRNAIPVLVEVKRATDTRNRREVVAQMLDYAANGVAYWPIGDIIASFEQSYLDRDEDPDQVLSAFTNDMDASTFWKNVETNLSAGRIRLVFLADKIPHELRRIVEFLNGQMRTAEVLAVELVQFVDGNGGRTLVPELIGDTSQAEAAKTVSASVRARSVSEWMSEMETRHGAEAGTSAERIVAFFAEKGLRPGISKTGDSLFFTLPKPDGDDGYVFWIRLSKASFEIALQHLKHWEAYETDASRLALLDQIRSTFENASKGSQKATSWPYIPLIDLLREDEWRAFAQLVDRIIEDVS